MRWFASFVEPRPPTDLDEPLQLRRDYLLAKLSSPPANGSAAAAASVTVPLGGLPSLPKDAMGVLTKHTSAGLTNTYRKRAFGASKLNLRKVRKLLGLIAPQPGAKLPFMEPSLPETLHSQLLRILLPAGLARPACGAHCQPSSRSTFGPPLRAPSPLVHHRLSPDAAAAATRHLLPRAHLPAVPRAPAAATGAAGGVLSDSGVGGLLVLGARAGLVNDCSVHRPSLRSTYQLRTPPRSC